MRYTLAFMCAVIVAVTASGCAPEPEPTIAGHPLPAVDCQEDEAFALTTDGVQCVWIADPNQ